MEVRMNEPFNQLTAAQAERLAMLAEEAGEIVQCVTKILRHGYESVDPTLPEHKQITNRRHLNQELGELFGIAYRMKLESDLPPERGDDATIIWEKKLNWTHHQ